MSLLPEVERELLRAARELPTSVAAADGDPELPTARSVHRRGARRVVADVLLVGAVVGTVGLAGVIFLLLDHAPDARHRPTHPAGQSGFGGVPSTQPGAWQRGGQTCPLAPASRYLPRRAGCVSVKRVSPGGYRELILVYGTLGTPRSGRGFPARSYTLEVIGRAGARFTTTIRHPQEPLVLISVEPIDSAGAIAILVHAGGISSGQFVYVYSFDGHQLRRTGPVFNYGGDSTAMEGFSCRRDPDRIVQRTFSAPNSGPTAAATIWDRVDRTYRWQGAVLRRVGTRRTRLRLHGYPPRSLTTADC